MALSGDQINEELLELVVRMRGERMPFALATVIETRGSTSAETGAKAVIDGDGSIISGWVGGGCAQSAVQQAALDCLESGDTAIVDLDLDDEVLGTGMPCGGAMRVFVEPFLPKPVLWILGHGRIAECLCQLGALVGLEVVVNDVLATDKDFPQARRVITDDLSYASFTPQPQDFVIIATQHKGDHESTQRALRGGARYLALIASHKRSRLILDYLREQGFGEKEVERVRAPAGLDLGAETPEEIALSVIAEIVQQRRAASGQPISRPAALEAVLSGKPAGKPSRSRSMTATPIRCAMPVMQPESK